MATAPLDRLMYTVTQAAAELSFSTARIREMCAAGEFDPPARKMGGVWRIPRLAITRQAGEPLPAVSSEDVESRAKRKQRARRIRELCIELLTLIDDEDD